MSAIVYPVRLDSWSSWLKASDGKELFHLGGGDFMAARRIAAALNATRHLTVEQLEACDDLRPARELSVELRALRRTWRESLGLTPEPINSGDAAEVE